MTIWAPRAVLLAMDFQVEIVEALRAGGSDAAVVRASGAVAAARTLGVPVIHVMVAYRPDFIDASLENKRVAMLRSDSRLLAGAPRTEIVEALKPAPNEAVVVKRRVSALNRTDLETLLSAYQARTLVMCGLSTSGVVLSTVRQAADLDYRIVVLADACADPDPEVHRLLTTKIFPSQAAVAASGDFCRARLAAVDDPAGARSIQFSSSAVA